MDITSIEHNTWVRIFTQESRKTIRASVHSQTEAEIMIAQFRDVMEDFYKVWPELKKEEK